MVEEAVVPPVILHVDMDCFYASVEQVRLNIPLEQPLAVQQWEGLIAVNYAARAAGVVRHDRVPEALHKCPSLHLVHVETIGDDWSRGVAARRNTAKVSLERYRQASKAVFDIFHQHADICERASIDEAYLDVTQKVNYLLKKDYDWRKELQRLSGDGVPENTKIIVENGPIEVCHPLCRRMLAGAIIAEQIRNDVRCKLGYTCSVGIAANKLLAKIASARNKPDKQTLISPIADVAAFMDGLPLKKIKFLGGKIGEQLHAKWGCQTAGDVQKLPIEDLIGSFGARFGNYLYKAVRGIYMEKVQEKQMTKSMLAAKSFQSTKDISVIRKWLGVLCDELSLRMLEDAKENSRTPQNLQLYYRSGLSQQTGEHSKSCNMPHTIVQVLRTAMARAPLLSNGVKDYMVVLKSKAESDERPPFCVNKDDVKNSADETIKTLSDLLRQASFGLFKRIEDPFPCTRLAIAASGFHGSQLETGCQSISHFFQSTDRSVKEVPLKPLWPHRNDGQNNSTEGIVHGTILPNEEHNLCEAISNFKNGSQSRSHLCQSSNQGVNEVSNGSLPHNNEVQVILTEQATMPEQEHYVSKEDFVFHKVHFAETSEPGGNSVTEFLEPTGNSLQGLESNIAADGDTCIDLQSIDVMQQRHILEEIYAKRAGGKGRTMSFAEDTKPLYRTGALKHRKVHSCESKRSVQETLSKYFHGVEKK